MNLLAEPTAATAPPRREPVILRQSLWQARAISKQFDERVEMQALLESLWLEKGVGALLITHDIEEAVALGDRVPVMGAGRFILEIPVDLLRPRDRSSREFVALKAQALHRLLTRSIQ